MIAEMIGFWLIALAVAITIIGICAWDFEIKERVIFVATIQSVIALLEVGIYLMQ